MNPFPHFKVHVKKELLFFLDTTPTCVYFGLPQNMVRGLSEPQRGVGTEGSGKGKRNVAVNGFLKGQSWSRRYTSPHQTTASAH